MRDVQGRFDGKPEISEAEALGVFEALRWIHHEQMTDVQLEKNCLQVIQVLQSKFRNNIQSLVLLLIYSIVN
jgi:ribonuclease HI